MPSRNKNFIILPKSWSGHGRTDRTGSAGPDIPATFVPLGDEIPLGQGHQIGVPPKNRYFTTKKLV